MLLFLDHLCQSKCALWFLGCHKRGQEKKREVAMGCEPHTLVFNPQVRSHSNKDERK